MTALDDRLAHGTTAIEFQLPVPTRLDDPAASWFRWLATPSGQAIDDRHPLAQLCAGESTIAWTDTLYTGSQGWRIRADRVGAQVQVYAWMADDRLSQHAAAPSSLARDVTGHVLDNEELAKADVLFRGTVESLHQAIYLYRPYWENGRIVDLEIVFCNRAALDLPFTEEIVPGALASKVFKNPELANLEAEEAWEHGSTTPYSIERDGLIDGVERLIRYEIRTRRVGDYILQTSTDHTIADDLQRSEARQRLILDAMGEGVTLLAPLYDERQRIIGTRVLYANEAAVGWRSANVGVFEGCEDGGDELRALTHIWSLEGASTDVVDRLDPAEPSVPAVYFELESERIGDVVLQVVRDRTEEMRSARERAAAERRFRTTIESLSESVGIWDPVRDADGRICDFVLRYANPSMSLHTEVGVLASDYQRDIDVDFVAMARTALVLHGRPITLNLNVRESENDSGWRTSLVEVEGEIVSVATDISEMQEVLGRLSASDSLLRSVLDSLTDSVRVYDAAGHLVYANEASEELLGPIPDRDDPTSPMPYSTRLLDGTPLAPTDTPRSRGLRGETVTDAVYAVHKSDDEDPRICSVTVRPMFIGSSKAPERVVVSAHDITEISRHSAELEWLASHKRQTGLLNLDGFLREVEQRTRQTGGSFAVIWISLTELETIRPTFGFAAGDSALVTAAGRLAAVSDQYGAIAAQPEDSALALLIPHVASGVQVQQIANELIQDLSRPFTSDSMSLLLGPVAGCAIGPLHGNDGDTLIRRSKTAAWHANRNGSNVLRWRADLGAEQLERVSLLGEFDRALTEEEIFLDFQPKYDAITQQLVGAEALVRWMHPTKGRIAPQAFVPGVEASALCRPFTLWAIRSALTQWAPVAALVPGAKVAVNVPVPLVSDLDFMEQLADVLVSIGVDPAWLQVEITERGLDGSIPDIQAGLEQMAMLGISIALDDFGTGQSSLAFLRKLTLNEVKIDRAFITNLQVDAANQAIVAACVAIARTSSMRVTAEGVETEEELAAVASLGCDYVQGYLLGRPMPIPSLLARLKA